MPRSMTTRLVRAPCDVGIQGCLDESRNITGMINLKLIV
uniref:Uncharacterized protein n=1 Tax=Arundo donax TaxID=35708 RepID=A0A0A9AIS7_ARUDO